MMSSNPNKDIHRYNLFSKKKLWRKSSWFRHRSKKSLKHTYNIF